MEFTTSCRDLDGPVCAAGDSCRSCWKKRHDLRPHFQEWRKRNGVPEPPPPEARPVLAVAVSRSITQVTAGAAAPAGGPGTELKMLFTSLGVDKAENCGCEALAKLMDSWGPEGCRKRLTSIAASLEANAVKVGWTVKLRAGMLAVWNGLPLTLEGMVLEAINRAEKKVQEAPSGP